MNARSHAEAIELQKKAGNDRALVLERRALLAAAAAATLHEGPSVRRRRNGKG